jgi:hypothetical protein
MVLSLTIWKRIALGSHRPMYARGHRINNVPGLNFRSDANYSTLSLPSWTSPGSYTPRTSPCRSETPNMRYHRGPRKLESIQTMTNGNSLSSASLASIVELYQRPVTTSESAPEIRSTGSFYYDYTEEFEKSPISNIEKEDPICPRPQRAESYSRHKVLREEARRNMHDETKEEMGERGKLFNSPKKGMFCIFTMAQF